MIMGVYVPLGSVRLMSAQSYAVKIPASRSRPVLAYSKVPT
jgi:hypothetical protein